MSAIHSTVKHIRQWLDVHPVPFGFLPPAFCIVFEILFQFWSSDALSLSSLPVPVCYSAAIGFAVGIIIELIPKRRAQRWMAAVFGILMAIVYLVEYYIHITYSVFMTPAMIVSGAGGVMTDYTDLVVSLVVNDLWRILLMLGIPLLSACLPTPSPIRKKRAGLAAAFLAVFLLIGTLSLNGIHGDLNGLALNHNYEGSIRTLGLPAAIAQNLITDFSGAEDELLLLDIPASLSFEDFSTESSAPETAPTNETEEASEETAPIEAPLVISETEPEDAPLDETIWEEATEETAEKQPAAAEVEVTEPETTEPEVTETELTEPEETVSEETEPEENEPDETEPEETEPEETEPEETEPEETEPEETEPEEIEPEGTEPEETEPEETEPEEIDPEEIEPEGTEPEEIEPKETEPEETEPEETEPEETEPPVYEPNILPLDYTAIGQASYTFQPITDYILAQKPSMKNEYTGLFAGKNLILITAEAFTKEVIDAELTPTLYRMAHKGIHFTDYYQPAWGGSTTSGEMSVLFGLVPDCSGLMKQMARQYPFFTMANQLKQQGYFTAAYHNNTCLFYDRNFTHTKLGYDSFTTPDLNDLKVTEGWPHSDLEMIQDSVHRYIDHQPFSVYYMTVSGHCPYATKSNSMSQKNYSAVANLPRSEAIKEYLASQLELEYAMTELIAQLEAAGIADDTVIVLTADHYPYGLSPGQTWGNTTDYVAELFGVNKLNDIIRDHSALIIWSGCLEDKNIQVDEPTFSLDILPTLSNLFGVPFDSRLFVGRDVFSDAEPFVFWPNYNWVTKAGYYLSSTKQFVPNEGYTVNPGYVTQVNNTMMNRINYSFAVQRKWFINYLGDLVYPDRK